MADLRSLGFTATRTVSTTNYPTEFVVIGPRAGNALDGGCCCLWTVPAGTTWVTFEMWGGGGTGGVSCCCSFGPSGGSGAYSIKTVCAANMGGWQYTICAAGSSGCSQSTAGCSGYTSYVNGCGLSNFCAAGGGQGCTWCWGFGGSYNCQTQYCCACANGGDLNIPGPRGEAIQTQYCGMQGQGFAPTAPAAQSGPMLGGHHCQWGGGQGWPCTAFPGGGGHSGIGSANSCCYAAPGAGGMVSVTYG